MDVTDVAILLYLHWDCPFVSEVIRKIDAIKSLI